MFVIGNGLYALPLVAVRNNLSVRNKNKLAFHELTFHVLQKNKIEYYKYIGPHVTKNKAKHYKCTIKQKSG